MKGERWLVLAVAAIQLWLAHRYFGFLTGDDVEVLSEAFRRAKGMAFTPWEVRNLFVPDVIVAPVVWLARGLDTARIIELTSLPFIALTIVTILLVRRLALKWSGGDERAAFLAMLLFALHWIPLGFGSTVYPRTLAMACIVAAAVIVERQPFIAGALVGLAFADRFSEIVFLAPLMVHAACRPGFSPAPSETATRQDRAGLKPGLHTLKLLAGTALVIALTVGLYDWLTWGSPFSSAFKFAHLTLIEPDFASRVKYQSPLWYLGNLLRWLAPTMLPLLWMARKRVQWLYLLLYLIVPLVALSAVQHKELRYVQTMIPFLAVAAGIGASLLWQRQRKLAAVLVGISLVWNFAGIRAFARKSQPAVMAAQWLKEQQLVEQRPRSLAVSQLWAYGGQLYFGAEIHPIELGTPPERVAERLSQVDTVAVWETDLDRPDLLAALGVNGFHAVHIFRDGPARPVVIYRR
jgi:hypothetical protein